MQAPVQPTGSRARLGFLILNLGHFYDHLFILVYATVAALALPQAFAMSYSDLILLATPMFVAFGAFALPAGWLADRWSRTGMLLVFFLGLGVTGILTSMARTPAELALGLFMIGVFASIYHPVGITMVVESHRTRTGMALAINGVWGNLGVAFAAVVAGVLIDVSSWRAAFLVPGVAAVLTGLLYALLLRGGSPHASEAAGSGSRPAAAPVARVVMTRILVVVIVTTTLGSFIFQSTTVSLPRVLDERLGDLASSASGVGLWAFTVFALASFAQLAIGHLIDRHSLRSVFALVAGLQLPVFLVLIGTEGWAVGLGALAFMLLVFGQIPINDTLLSRVTTREYRSRIYAVKFVISFAVSALAVPCIAWLHGHGGFDWLFAVMAALAALILLAVLSLPSGHAAMRPAPA